MVTRDFLTAGKAIFTVEVPTGFGEKPHYTFRITRKAASLQFPETFFVGMLTGPDNEEDYVYVGILNPTTGQVILTKKSAYPADSFPIKLLQRIIARIWLNDHAAYEQHGFQTHHVGKCGRCARTLTTPESITRGIGPECWEKMAG